MKVLLKKFVFLTELHVDNQAARDLAYNPEHHKRTKHIDRRHFFGGTFGAQWPVDLVLTRGGMLNSGIGGDSPELNMRVDVKFRAGCGRPHI